jgi:hypothetical protein
MEACEAREYGSESKRNHQVEGAIIQAKEWMRTWKVHVVTKQQIKHECTREEPRGGER